MFGELRQFGHIRLSAFQENPIVGRRTRTGEGAAEAGRRAARRDRQARGYSRGMPEVHAARRRRAQRLIREGEADAALITAGPNVRYLTGLASSNAALLLPADGDLALLATDSRYTGAALRDAPDLELATERFIEAKLATEASRRGYKRLAFEAHEMTVERHGELVARADGVATHPFGRQVESLRMVKDDEELEKLTVACRLSDAAFAEVLPRDPSRYVRTGGGSSARRSDDRPRCGTHRVRHHRRREGTNGAIPHHAPDNQGTAAR